MEIIGYGILLSIGWYLAPVIIGIAVIVAGLFANMFGR